MSLLTKVKTLLGKTQDNEGWIRQGKFTPVKNLRDMAADSEGWFRQGQFTPKKQIEPLIKTIQNYQQQVNQAKQTPFFNSNNTPTQWIGKVGQEFKNRGIGEGIHGLTNPITMNPYIRPITEEVVGNIRTANYKAGRPSHLLNIMLGQQDHQMADKGKSGKETYLEKLEKLFATQGLIKAQQFTQPAVSNVQAWANPQVRQQFNQAVIQPKINQITGPQPKGPLPTMAPLVSQGSLKNPLLDKLAEITGQSTRALINAVPSLVNSFSNKYVYNPETKKAFPASRLRPENSRFSDAEQKLLIKGFKDKSVKSTKEWQEINKRFWDNSTEEGIRLAMVMALTKSQKMGKFDEKAVQENFNRMFGKGGSTVALRNGPGAVIPNIPSTKLSLPPVSPIKTGGEIKIKAGNDQNLLSNQQNPLGTGKPSVSSSQESRLQAPQSTLPKIKIKVGQPNQISSGKPPSEPIIPQIKLSDIEKKIYGSETKLGNTGNKISVGPIGDKIRIVENKANEIIAKGLTAKNPVIRTSATLFQDLFGGAGKSQGQLSQKAQFRGGTDYATKIAGDTQNYIYNLLNNNTKSLEKVHAVLDPEISKIKVNESSLTSTEKEVLKLVREASDYINDTNYSLGFISKDLWQKNRGGKYLARAYEVFDYPPEVADFIKNKSIKFDLNPFKKRTEMTDWKKENAITDPAYLISKRLQQTLFNVEVKKYVDWATKSNLISDVQRPGFVQLSDSKAYGSAAGKWIRKDALEDIKGFFLTNDIGQKAYDLLTWWDRNPLRRTQKMLKTVFNPAVRLGNKTGNYVFAWISGINPVAFTKNRIWAKNALNTNDPIYRYAVKNGLTGSDITKADITRISAELKRGITDKNTLQKINDWAKESYGRVDDVSKVAAFKTWLDRGISPEEALNRTRRGFQDYSMIGMLYDLGAKIPVLGNPFVRFASESIRIAKNAAVDHPFRLAATISAWVLFKNVMSRMTGETEKDRKTREGRVGASHLPFTNISTSVMTPYGEINASRLLGFSSTFTPEDTGKFGSFGTDLSKYGPFQNPLDARNYTSDPLIGPIISIATDKDFRGKSIADPKQNKYTGSLLTPGEQNMNRLGYGLRSYLPPSFTDLYNIGAAIQGKENVYGQVKTPLQAILRTYPGIKIEQFGPEEAEATRQRNADYNAYELDYIQKQINAVKKQQVEGKITPQQAEKRIDSLNKEKITSQSDRLRTFETSPEAPKDIMERISLATKATVTNPTNALKVIQAIFTEEKMRKLSGDTLIFERETNLNKTKEKGDAVDHIIPLSLGGDNSDRNIRYISAEANQEKAKLETSLARKLADNEITGAEARKQIKDYMNKFKADYTPSAEIDSTESNGEPIGKIYKITNKETGKETEIELTFPEYPKLTGLIEADKALKSAYYSALSKIKTNATKLYNDGQLTAQEYNDILVKIKGSKSSSSGTTKTKSKGGKISLKKSTIKLASLPTFKAPSFGKLGTTSYKTIAKPNIKLSKPKTIVVAPKKKSNTIKIKPMPTMKVVKGGFLG